MEKKVLFISNDSLLSRGIQKDLESNNIKLYIAYSISERIILLLNSCFLGNFESMTLLWVAATRLFSNATYFLRMTSDRTALNTKVYFDFSEFKHAR